MRPFKYVPFIAVFLIPLLLGCNYNSSSSSSSSSTPTSGLKKRVLVSNQEAGTVAIVDAAKDVLSTFSISMSGPSKMVTSGGFTTVINSNTNLFSVIDNTKEQATQSSITGDKVVDVAISKDGATAYGAVRNAGVINILTTGTGNILTVNLSSVSRVVISPNGTKVLAFVDDPQALPAPFTGAFFIIDAASRAITTVIRPGSCTATTPVVCEQPFTAVFNGSETKAFIFNCGPECGGTAGSASVVQVDFSGSTPAFSSTVPVCGATVGLLSNSTLFVAGTAPVAVGGCPAGGALQMINTGTMTASTPIAITDGQHGQMQLASNNRLYIGASACTPVHDSSTGLNHGCLTIFNTSSSAVVVPELSALHSSFDVTGIQPISNRTVVYVCEGGFLDIYDTNTDALTPTQVDIIGFAFDVVQIDP